MLYTHLENRIWMNNRHYVYIMKKWFPLPTKVENRGHIEENNCCYPFLYFGPFLGMCLWAEGVMRSIYRPEKPKGKENCGRQGNEIRPTAQKSPVEKQIVGGRATK